MPDELGGRADAETTIRFAAPEGLDPGEVPAPSGRLTVATANDGGATIEIATGEPVAALNALTGWALERSVDLQGLEVSRPSLEDVYLELTEEP
jgi:ABC-2 type transport system ATP-binding protein